MDFESASDIQKRVNGIIDVLELNHITAQNVICMRSYKSKARAYARIWSLPRIWQKALGVDAHYILEVLSEHFDKQSVDDQDRTLIHELMHIPKTFSGALVPHSCFGKKIDRRSVEKLYRVFVLKRLYSEDTN
ncbi:MAG: metallopeptidase [Candidatus Nanohalarchaeota archaeon]|nr:MAG: metallopeptidase [Candidatus Nanohaloarchaeota archaeon]